MDKVALVLVGHGSVLPHNREMIEAFSRMIEKRGEYDVVKYSFIQINEPLLEDALMGLAEDGVEKVVVSPVFLAKGVHTTSDITEAIEKAERKTGIKIAYADPLGADPRVVDILLDRAKEAAERIE
ncbi:MAG: sirohydrochlorin nickelochelatase [Candidatus Syntrophoarchaeum sp.]|nr:sirohydrochlorin nickelochelatase [Candidatus Syntrophoarchaeum sp.]